MKTKHLLASLAMCCAVAALVGCTSTDGQMSRSALDEKRPERTETLSSTGLSQPVILEKGAFRKLDLDTNEAVTLDEWRHFDTNAAATDNFSMPDENGHGQINVIEFPTQALKHSKLYPVFGDAEQINNNHFSWDQQEFQPQGLRLFSIHF
jgi:hypothetical protein